MTTSSTTAIAKAVINASCYTIEEIKADYKSGKSEDWRRGFFAARGFNWLQGQFIEQGLKLR